MFYGFIFVFVGIALIFLGYIFFKLNSYIVNKKEENGILQNIINPFGIKDYGTVQLIMFAMILFVVGTLSILLGIASITGFSEISSVNS